MKLLLTHVPLARRQYYGARALAQLHELAEVTLHEAEAPLDPRGLIAAAQDVDLIIADRATPVPAEVFAGLPKLKAALRSAIDIRNIDVAAASQASVLVTHAEAGFVQSVVELTVGLLVDLSRGMSRAATAYHQGRKPEIKVGRQLAGSMVGIIGYGRISRELAPVLAALGMTVLVSDPYAQVDDRRFVKLPFEELLGRADAANSVERLSALVVADVALAFGQADKRAEHHVLGVVDGVPAGLGDAVVAHFLFRDVGGEELMVSRQHGQTRRVQSFRFAAPGGTSPLTSAST